MERQKMSIKKLSKTRRNDPHFDREVAKYEHPLPSRQYVLQVQEEQGKPVSFDELSTLLDIHLQDSEMFLRRLAAVSYTHLDVYKRQRPNTTCRPTLPPAMRRPAPPRPTGA